MNLFLLIYHNGGSTHHYFHGLSRAVAHLILTDVDAALLRFSHTHTIDSVDRTLSLITILLPTTNFTFITEVVDTNPNSCNLCALQVSTPYPSHQYDAAHAFYNIHNPT